MKNQLYITLGGKGGVGKTVIAVLLADFLNKLEIPFLAYDCDTENAGKAAAFSTAYPQAERVNLRSIADCDRLITEAAQHEITIADLPANASGDFLEWWEAVSQPETLEALNLEVVGIGSITPEPGTFASVAQWASSLQDSMRYVISLNHRTQQRVALPREQSFPEYFSTTTGRRFREAFKPYEIEVAGLYDVSMSRLAKSGMLPSLAAADPDIPILDRTRIKAWAGQVHNQLRGALL